MLCNWVIKNAYCCRSVHLLMSNDAAADAGNISDARAHLFNGKTTGSHLNSQMVTLFRSKNIYLSAI